MTGDGHELLRIALAGAGDIEEWRLGDPAAAAAHGYPRRFDVPVLDDFGTVFVDVTLLAGSGEVVCHEVNGPNGVGSDALTGDSELRADLEARQTVRHLGRLGLLDGDGGVRRPVTTVHAHQHWSAFRTGGEFFPRVDRYARRLAELLPQAAVRPRAASSPAGDEAVAVVMGDVPAVAGRLAVDPDTGAICDGDRPVVFVGNPNLLPELARTGKVQVGRGRFEGIDRRAFHGWRLVNVVHDKSRQQALLHSTGIRPLLHFTAWTRDDAIAATREFLANGPCVLKPNAASGGVGVEVVVPGATDADIAEVVDAVVARYVAKYGEGAEATVYPLRGFEFARSTGFPLDGGEHLWDLRIAVLFEPGTAHVFPVSMRLTPEPFDPATFAHDRDQWVSNVSGRTVTLLKSGMDDAALDAVGMTQERIDDLLAACVTWTVNAWDASARGDEGLGAYEDDREARDPSFYPRERWA
jgi:hypothetical protein